jgi:hypothetical protein
MKLFFGYEDKIRGRASKNAFSGSAWERERGEENREYAIN